MISSMTTETISKKLFTADEYFRMWEVGILPEEGRFELIRGEIIEMPIPGRPHRSLVDRLNHLFSLALGRSAIVRVQNAVPLDTHSVPFPDLTLLQPRPDFYSASEAEPEDVLLVVEVSDTSVWYDANVKAPVYASAGIAEYWQLNVQKEVVIVRTNPVEGEYRTVQILHRGENLRPVRLPGVTFTVDDMIG